MTDILNKATVLVLNRNWQAINVRTPKDAFLQMATDVATALDIAGEDNLRPVTWAEWITLPIRAGDNFVATPRRQIRVPTVIVCVNYASVPKRRPAFNARTVRERDSHRCQYTGKVLRPDEAAIDHVVPRARGGHTGWDNCVLADRAVNQRKGDRLPHEAGLRLLRTPKAPAAVPTTVLIRNVNRIRDWELFLVARRG